MTGALLARGQRTVTAVLRVMGLGDETHFVNYYRVLQRAVWSSLAVSRTLLLILIQTFVPTGPLLVGGDDTIERRWAPRLRPGASIVTIAAFSCFERPRNTWRKAGLILSLPARFSDSAP